MHYVFILPSISVQNTPTLQKKQYFFVTLNGFGHTSYIMMKKCCVCEPPQTTFEVEYPPDAFAVAPHFKDVEAEEDK